MRGRRKQRKMSARFKASSLTLLGRKIRKFVREMDKLAETFASGIKGAVELIAQSVKTARSRTQEQFVLTSGEGHEK